MLPQVIKFPSRQGGSGIVETDVQMCRVKAVKQQLLHFIEQLQGRSDAARDKARELVDHKRKDSALMYLRSRKQFELQCDKQRQTLANIDQILIEFESASTTKDVVALCFTCSLFVSDYGCVQVRKSGTEELHQKE